VQSGYRETIRRGEGSEIVPAIIAMAHSLDTKVVAKGVETEGQYAFLRAHGCDAMQGYLFSKRPSPDELADLRREERSLSAAGPT